MSSETVDLRTPTIFIILGSTGDLASRKIVPALFGLYQKDLLPPKFRVIGFARTDLGPEGFRRFLSRVLSNPSARSPISRRSPVRHASMSGSPTSRRWGNSFLGQFYYCQGDLMRLADYGCLVTALAEVDKEWGVCANKLFYLAIPPALYKTVLEHLAKSGLTKPCGPKEGWTRVLVEKPFGKDLKTAQELDAILGKLFKEIQVYRIDHYLAKEMVQNILNFRFSNNLFEGIWNRNYIEKIDIRLWEKIGVEERGEFYDDVGALRDVGQNHLLQLLALIAMENPGSWDVETIRKERARILNQLHIFKKNEINRATFRAQYKGYQNIRGVKPDSRTETYFKILAFLDSSRWAGVPVFLESGKRLGEVKKEVIVTFKHPVPCLLCPAGTEEHFKNQIRIAWEPKEEIEVYFWSKKQEAKHAHAVERRPFLFTLREKEKKLQYVEEYQQLLLEAIEGDQLLFVSTQEVTAMWRFIDPIVRTWQANAVPLHFYKPDTLEPIEMTKEFFREKFSQNKYEMKHRTIGIVGLGKMGGNMAQRLKERGWRVAGYDKKLQITHYKLQNSKIQITNQIPIGIVVVSSLQELVAKLPFPRIVLLMVPAGGPVEETLKNLISAGLKRGDIVIDGGNSFYKDSVRRFKHLQKKGIHFVDVGISGGPGGARHGASLMIGGERKIFERLQPFFRDLAAEGGYQFFPGAGAGHFVKMVHNGIEYGMMQAIAEGFTILKNSNYKLNLVRVADVYNHGSVVESRLVGWLKEAFDLYGQDLRGVSGVVVHTGEGEWTVKTAKEMKLKAKIIEGALEFRKKSAKNPSYTGKILTALRNRFGGHPIESTKFKIQNSK